jgi:hypothetical protein
MLTASQTAGDMPGTLDETVLEDFTCKYGTFDSSKQVYFGFLVLNNTADLATLDISTTPYAIHSNSNFKNASLSWYIPS